MGRGVSRAAAGAWWTTARDWRGAPLPAEVQARLARAEARLPLLAAQIAALEHAAGSGGAAAAPESAVAAAGAAERGRDDERLGAARRGLGLARVSQSAGDWRAARVRAGEI